MLHKLTRLLGTRTVQFVAVPIAVLVWFLLTDPSHGADTFLRLQLWAQALLVTGLAYPISKAMLGNAKSEDLYEQVSLDGSIGAAIAYLGICLVRIGTLASLLVFFGMVQR